MTQPLKSLAGATCLVVGGGGFLGAQLCPKLLALGARVRGYGRTRYFSKPLEGVRWLNGALEDVQKLASVVDGADVVFHLAGTSTPASAEASRIGDLATNVGGSLGLLDLCRHAGVNRVVFTSSGGTVYGDAKSPPFSEETLPRPISSYGINKLTAEQYFRLYNRLYGMRNVVLRIANPFGPYQHGLKNQGAVSIFARRALEGANLQIWGDGSIARDYLHGGDVADAMIKAALYPGEHVTFNVGSGIGRSLNDVVAALREVLERDIAVDYTPARRIDVQVSVLDCERAASELGWRASPDFIAALKDTCAWIKTDMASASVYTPSAPHKTG